MGGREHILDELLVLRCQEGRREAFEKLVARWQKRLWHHAFRLVGREDAAWDVLQDAWVAVTRSIRALADPRSFRRWAYTIVTRSAADWQRRNHKHESGRERDGDAVRDVPAGEAEGDAGPVDLVREGLSRLSGERRALLSLRYFEDFDLWEIAEILGVPEGTVKSRLFHARQKLKEIMEKLVE